MPKQNFQILTAPGKLSRCYRYNYLDFPGSDVNTDNTPAVILPTKACNGFILYVIAKQTGYIRVIDPKLDRYLLLGPIKSSYHLQFVNHEWSIISGPEHIWYELNPDPEDWPFLTGFIPNVDVFSFLQITTPDSTGRRSLLVRDSLPGTNNIYWFKITSNYKSKLFRSYRGDRAVLNNNGTLIAVSDDAFINVYNDQHEEAILKYNDLVGNILHLSFALDDTAVYAVEQEAAIMVNIESGSLVKYVGYTDTQLYQNVGNYVTFDGHRNGTNPNIEVELIYKTINFNGLVTKNNETAEVITSPVTRVFIDNNDKNAILLNLTTNKIVYGKLDNGIPKSQNAPVVLKPYNRTTDSRSENNAYSFDLNGNNIYYSYNDTNGQGQILRMFGSPETEYQFESIFNPYNDKKITPLSTSVDNDWLVIYDYFTKRVRLVRQD